MIRKLEEKDVNEVMKIWLKTNIRSHNFISEEYWKNNFNNVKSAILEADTYVFEQDNEIVAFVGIVDGYIAGIFVKESMQSKGIGRKLIEYCKLIYPELSLKVYKNNERAIKFYQREKFEIIEESLDEENKEIELLLKWFKK